MAIGIIPLTIAWVRKSPYFSQSRDDVAPELEGALAVDG
jgi:hypothetical protein